MAALRPDGNNYCVVPVEQAGSGQATFGPNQAGYLDGPADRENRAIPMPFLSYPRHADANLLRRQMIEEKPPPVRLDPIPEVQLPPVTAPDSAEVARIKDLIRQLARIDSPDFGLSSTMSGTAFAPIAGSESAGAFLLTNHGLQHSNAFVELVRLGPRALPFLLDAVDDSTPTKLTIKVMHVIGWMQFSKEMDGNPANQRETKVLATLPQKERIPSGSDRPRSYTVTVGDACFVIIGQIVGRSYEAMRYQPTAGTIVNSPTHDPNIAKAVRAIWSSDNPTQHLLDSLLLDYSTRGIYQGGKDMDTAFGHWYVGSRPQIPAAMRLLFYFPRLTAPLIARRLDRFHVQMAALTGKPTTDPEYAAWIKRELANDVGTEDFIKAVAWCPEPEIRASLHSIFQRAGDDAILLAALPALDRSRDWPLVQRQLGIVLRRQPRDEDGWYGTGYNTLIALRQFGGDKARPLYREYLKGAKGSQRSFSVCQALEDTNGECDQEFLWPMLLDKRPSKGYSHRVKRNCDEPRRPIRVCDEAAEKISLHRKDVKFVMVGTEQELDHPIRQMQKQLTTAPQTPPKR